MSQMGLNPEIYPLIEAHEPAASDAINDGCDAIKLTNAAGCLIIIHEDYANDTTKLVLTVHEGTTAAIAAAGGSQITTKFPVWFNVACQTNDILVRQSDTYSFELDGVVGGNNCLTVAYISASILTAGYSWIHAGFDTTGHAANTASVLYMLDKIRYAQTTPPTAIA